MIHSRGRRVRNQTQGALIGVAATALAGCFSVPGPAAPSGANLEIGADYRAQSVSRWVCEEWGSIVLAKTAAGQRLHLENLDWVMSPVKEQDGTAVFGFTTSAGGLTLSYLDMAQNEVVTTKTEVGVGQTLFAVATKPGGAILVRMGGEPTKDDTCELVSEGGGP